MNKESNHFNAAKAYETQMSKQSATSVLFPSIHNRSGLLEPKEVLSYTHNAKHGTKEQTKKTGVRNPESSHRVASGIISLSQSICQSNLDSKQNNLN